ncbi:hypothetical protein [Paenibacillus algorifonticola]|uniref:hypothetical protein n=1 Tax=Paenibacillus algorifonticola TaxID=684063 RepID=UPI0006198E59|nr:hypothetical protein [Paenibacillus algorifonticola]
MPYRAIYPVYDRAMIGHDKSPCCKVELVVIDFGSVKLNAQGRQLPRYLARCFRCAKDYPARGWEYEQQLAAVQPPMTPPLELAASSQRV